MRPRPRGIDLADGLLLAVPFLALFPLRNNDLWWHLASGRWMVAHGTVPHGDPFSFTGFLPGWIDNEWLTQLALYAAWWVGDNLGLVILRAAVYAAIFGLLRGYLREARQPAALLPSLAIGVALSYGWWEIRPSAFSIAATLALLWILERIRRSGRGYALLPVLFLFWASVHPGFLFGILVVVGTVAAVFLEGLLPGLPRWSPHASAASKLAVWGLASIALTLANPYGWKAYHQQAAIAGNAAYRAILDEWAPPTPAFLVVALSVVVAFLAMRWRRVPLASLVPILGATALATTGIRFVEYFALIAVPPMLAGVGRLRRQPAKLVFVGGLVVAALAIGLQPPLSAASAEGSPSVADPAEVRLEGRLERNALGIALLLGAGVAVAAIRRDAGWLLARSRGRTGWGGVASGVAIAGIAAWAAPSLSLLPRDYVEPDRYPTTCLASVPSERSRVFNRLSWGGWLIWKREMPTFIDGRCSGQRIFFDYRRAHGPEWREVFDSYGIDVAVVAAHDTVAGELARDVGWSEVCRDPVAVVFRRLRLPSP